MIATLLGSGLTLACSSEDGPTGPGAAPGDVGEYLKALPPWAAFAPALPDQAPTAAGAAVSLPQDTVDVEHVEDDGSVTVVPDVVYACSERPYSVRTNPTQIVMYSPDAEILWPGSLIQGKSHRDGLGALLGLTIAERTPIRVSIPAIPSADNFREVASPDQAQVAAAIGAIRGNATTANLATPSTITFEQTVSYSESQLALSLRLSARYLGFATKAAADFSRNGSQTTVTAQFYQKMFEVVVAPPQTPGAFFSSAFTKAKLDQQIALGRMGPDNIPVYVSTVVYGRMLMVSVTSSESEQKIRAALEASYNAVAGSASGSVEAKHRTLLRESRISITSLGGDAEATLAMIRSGDLSQYFTKNAPLSSAAPLSYTFRNLSDGSIASVTEATQYNLKTCEARPASPGSFEFRSLVSAPIGIPTPVRTFAANVDGKAGKDLIFNHLGATNQLRVATADATGTFTLGPVVTHPETPAEGWANYTPVVGDFNGDGEADIAWTNLSAAGNRTYLGLSKGDGTFGFPSVRTVTGNWSGYRTLAGDLNGDGCDYLFWNVLG
ncbi:MAG: thiol-activated cytolysin family protein, partial [bacterium]